jgi:hypothetical protein
MQKLFSLAVAGTAIALAGAVYCPTADAQWGTLKGKIILDGDLPKIAPLVVKGDQKAKDAAVCAAEEVPDEKLVVDPESKGIANVVVYLQKKPAKIHPSVEKSTETTVNFDQKGCRFLPPLRVDPAGRQEINLRGWPVPILCNPRRDRLSYLCIEGIKTTLLTRMLGPHYLPLLASGVGRFS